MTVRRTDLAGAARAIDSLVARLADPDAVRDAIGQSAASEINARGSRTGVPRQAHLVAGAFSYRTEAIRLNGYALAGNGTAGQLVFGAEFGSDRYTQFGPRRSGGAWIFPVLRELPTNVLAEGDRAVDDLIGDAL